MQVMQFIDIQNEDIFIFNFQSRFGSIKLVLPRHLLLKKRIEKTCEDETIDVNEDNIKLRWKSKLGNSVFISVLRLITKVKVNQLITDALL
jgi:hypothetical protein